MVPLELRIFEMLIKPSAVEAMGATTDNGRSVNRSSICQVDGEVGIVVLLNGMKNKINKNPMGSNKTPMIASLDMRLSGEVSLEREELLISYTIRPCA